MKIDATEKVLLDRYLKRKKELYPEEISYCEKLIKKIVQEIIKNDLIKKIKEEKKNHEIRTRNKIYRLQLQDSKS